VAEREGGAFVSRRNAARVLLRAGAQRLAAPTGSIVQQNSGETPQWALLGGFNDAHHRRHRNLHLHSLAAAAEHETGNSFRAAAALDLVLRTIGVCCTRRQTQDYSRLFYRWHLPPK
jgi:hypothetical protein